MNARFKLPLHFLCLLVIVLRAAGLAAPARSASLDLQDGDTVVFLGDSITHQCLYTQYVEDFFHTRFPERRIHFHNAGVGGDKAADVLARFDDDVAAAKRDALSAWLIEHGHADTSGAFASVPADRESAIGRAVITHCLSAAHGRDHAHQW